MVNYPTAAGDLTGGFRRFDIWLGLAWLDLKLRYRRTLVGPFWLPLSSVVTIAVMGFIYGKLFKMNLAEYFPYLACGLALWSLISSFIANAHSVFVSMLRSPIRRRSRIRYTCCGTVANGFIQFIHTSVSFWAVAICFGVPFGIHTLMALPALAMLAWFGIWITLGLGTVCLRFRDLAQIIIVGTQLLFLATPIFWKIDLLADQHWLATCNPCFHLLEICRAPLLGQPTPWNSWLAVLVINGVGSVLAFAVFAHCRNRLAYWM